jgi:hypothetical protein
MARVAYQYAIFKAYLAALPAMKFFVHFRILFSDIPAAHLTLTFTTYPQLMANRFNGVGTPPRCNPL